MKAIILAAGEGTRLRPLSITTPKPLIKIFGKSIIEHNLENIYKFVDEIIVVVKYKKEIFFEKLGDDYKGVKITFVVQNDEKGTAAAIKGINLKDTDILLLNGDSIFGDVDLENLIKLDGYGCLVQKVQEPSKYGIFMQDDFLFATKIIEKPSEYIGNLANIGVYKFNSQIFEISKKVALSQRGEYEITDSINEFIKNNKFILIESEKPFIDVGYPWDILNANSIFLDKLEKSEILGEVESGVTIKGNIILGKGSILKSGTYIEGNVYIGENTSVGPNTYLRGNTVIGNNCKLGNAVELKNSSLGDFSNIAHLTYIGDSVIGNHVNIGGGLITANLRHDKQSIKVMINEKLVDTKLSKLGCIIGDNVKTGIKTIIYPGRIIENDSFTLPGDIVK